MARGRKPTPTALKLTHGNPGKRKINDAEPKPKAARPPMPPTVRGNAIAKTCWNWLCGELETMGVLTTADARTMELYCAAYVEWRVAVATLRSKGRTYEVKTGVTTTKGKMHAPRVKRVARRPEVAIAFDYSRMLIQIGSELGLSPAARTRIKVTRSEEESNPVAALMAQATRRRRGG